MNLGTQTDTAMQSENLFLFTKYGPIIKLVRRTREFVVIIFSNTRIKFVVFGADHFKLSVPGEVSTTVYINWKLPSSQFMEINKNLKKSLNIIFN